MTAMRQARTAMAAVAALLLLAGCSNDPQTQERNEKFVTGLRDLVQGGSAQQAALPSPEAVLAATTGPLLFVEGQETGAQTYLQRIEVNAGVETFAFTGRRTLSLKNGFVVATRGLGDDVMSADIERVSQLVRARQPGRVTRAIRHLSGEGIITVRRFICDIKPVDANSVIEQCYSPDMKIRNGYQLDADGNIVRSTQWISDKLGYFRITHLRR